MTTERLKEAMRGQYRAGIAMVRGAIEMCPDELWTSGNHPRQFWRQAYHVLFFTHFYLEVKDEDFQRWELDTEEIEAVAVTPHAPPPDP